jgi:hypothetical protein
MVKNWSRFYTLLTSILLFGACIRIQKFSQKKMTRNWSRFYTLLTSILLFGACIKNPEFTQNAQLRLSTDTIFFDTVFTRQAQTGTYPISVTKLFSIKNTSDFWVKADFYVAGGEQSPYRINIDGISGNRIDQLEIGPQDSVFVFVQCRLRANNETQPILVLDSLYARVGTQQSKMVLAAYGWDAHYVRDSIIPNNTVWSDKTKPYVIIDGAYVAPNSKFTIEKGVQIFASARTGLYVFGHLKMNGTAEERIQIRGDKPIAATKTMPNQWYGMYFGPGGTGDIAFSDITNAVVGMRSDSQALGNDPCLILKNTRIQYCGQACIIGVSGAISAENCLFADAGSYSFLGYYGGNYQFNHCTFADFSYFTNRNNGHFGLTNTLRDGNGFLINTLPLTLTLQNSIIWGYKNEELALDRSTAATFSINNSSYNLFRSQDELDLFGGQNNLFNRDPHFAETKGDYHLESNSNAKDKIPSLSLFQDLEGKPRNAPADIGAYEFQ